MTNEVCTNRSMRSAHRRVTIPVYVPIPQYKSSHGELIQTFEVITFFRG